MIELSEFFDAFKPVNGGLSGVESHMHACLKDQDITSKPFDVFCTDVDVDDEHRVTLYSLNRYTHTHALARLSLHLVAPVVVAHNGSTVHIGPAQLTSISCKGGRCLS